MSVKQLYFQIPVKEAGLIPILAFSFLSVYAMTLQLIFSIIVIFNWNIDQLNSTSLTPETHNSALIIQAFSSLRFQLQKFYEIITRKIDKSQLLRVKLVLCILRKF